jgi:hypothetical protein
MTSDDTPPANDTQTVTQIDISRLKDIARQVCFNIGVDPDEVIDFAIDTTNSAKMPRWATLASRVQDILINREINNVIDDGF